MAKVENGAHIFSRKVINRIANEFGVSAVWLETGEGQAPFMHNAGGDENKYSNVHIGKESDYFLIPLYPQKSGEGMVSEKGLHVKIMPLKS